MHPRDLLGRVILSTWGVNPYYVREVAGPFYTAYDGGLARDVKAPRSYTLCLDDPGRPIQKRPKSFIHEVRVKDGLITAHDPKYGDELFVLEPDDPVWGAFVRAATVALKPEVVKACQGFQGKVTHMANKGLKKLTLTLQKAEALDILLAAANSRGNTSVELKTIKEGVMLDFEQTREMINEMVSDGLLKFDNDGPDAINEAQEFHIEGIRVYLKVGARALPGTESK